MDQTVYFQALPLSVVVEQVEVDQAQLMLLEQAADQAAEELHTVAHRQGVLEQQVKVMQAVTVLRIAATADQVLAAVVAVHLQRVQMQVQIRAV